MNYFPGLTVRAPDNRPDMASELLDALFLSGGLYLSQVSRLTGLAYYEVQNWVKRKYLTQPVHKTYSRRQFCRIVLINHLRQGMQIESIVKLLEHINGHLDDESDDLIDDAGLYNYYVNALLAVGDRLELPEVRLELREGKPLTAALHPYAGGEVRTITLTHDLTAEEIHIIQAGGVLNC